MLSVGKAVEPHGRGSRSRTPRHMRRAMRRSQAENAGGDEPASPRSALHSKAEDQGASTTMTGPRASHPAADAPGVRPNPARAGAVTLLPLRQPLPPYLPAQVLLLRATPRRASSNGHAPSGELAAHLAQTSVGGVGVLDDVGLVATEVREQPVVVDGADLSGDP